MLYLIVPYFTLTIRSGASSRDSFAKKYLSTVAKYHVHMYSHSILLISNNKNESIPVLNDDNLTLSDSIIAISHPYQNIWFTFGLDK